MLQCNKYNAFNLTEILIAIAVFAVISTFAVPKILTAQSQQAFNAAGKEAVFAIKYAYSQLKLNKGVGSNTYAKDLTPYINYVSIRTTGFIDNAYGSAGSRSCSDNCYILKSGAAIWLNPGNQFGGNAENRYVYFYVDPNAQLDSTDWDGKQKSLHFNLYFNGRIVDFGNCEAGDLTYQGSDQSWCPGNSPPWLSWQ